MRKTRAIGGGRLGGRAAHQIKSTKLVDKEEAMRIAAFDSFAATYKYCCYPIDLSINRLRQPDTEIYRAEHTFLSNYDEQILWESFY